MGAIGAGPAPMMSVFFVEPLEEPSQYDTTVDPIVIAAPIIMVRLLLSLAKYAIPNAIRKIVIA